MELILEMAAVPFPLCCYKTTQPILKPGSNVTFLFKKWTVFLQHCINGDGLNGSVTHSVCFLARHHLGPVYTYRLRLHQSLSLCQWKRTVWHFNQRDVNISSWGCLPIEAGLHLGRCLLYSPPPLWTKWQALLKPLPFLAGTDIYVALIKMLRFLNTPNESLQDWVTIPNRSDMTQTLEFFLNVFAEFSDKNICHYS